MYASDVLEWHPSFYASKETLWSIFKGEDNETLQRLSMIDLSKIKEDMQHKTSHHR